MEDAPLPQWREGESRDAWVAEGWIAGWDLLGAQPELMPEPLSDVTLPEPPVGMSTDLPPSAEPVADKWADAYFAAPADKDLVDPQSLLTPPQREHLLQLLCAHAEESAVPLKLYLFGQHQEIPSEWRAEEQAERLDPPGRPAVTVMYFLGAPHRSEILLSPVLARQISISEQRRTEESCLLQAQAKVDPIEQLDAYLQQLAIRAYWIGHTCGLEREQEGLSPNQPAKPHHPVSARGTPKWNLPPKLQERMNQFQVYWPWIAGGAVAFCISAILGIWLLLRRKRKFPIIGIEPRLGGIHAAGVGAAISFASTHVSPAAQRENPPDLN